MYNAVFFSPLLILIVQNTEALTYSIISTFQETELLYMLRLRHVDRSQRMWKFQLLNKNKGNFDSRVSKGKFENELKYSWMTRQLFSHLTESHLTLRHQASQYREPQSKIKWLLKDTRIPGWYQAHTHKRRENIKWFWTLALSQFPRCLLSKLYTGEARKVPEWNVLVELGSCKSNPGKLFINIGEAK